MKTKFYGPRSTRGSALLAAMIVVILMSTIAAGVLSYSLTGYRASVRQSMLDKAKVLADSEMEGLYFNWKSMIIHKQSMASITTGYTSYYSMGPTTPLSTDQRTTAGGVAWSVTRSLAFNPIAANADGSAQGLDKTQTMVAKNYYFTAKTSASADLPLIGTISYRAGRHFTYSSTSLFQFAVFYQGNLEMSAGSNMEIDGPMSTNTSAYLAAQAHGSSFYNLVVTDKVYYFQNFNGASDPLTGDQLSMAGNTVTSGSTTINLTGPTFNPDPTSGTTPDQALAREAQVQKLKDQYNFVGGVDVAADVAPTSPYAAAYVNQLGVVDPNEVYRAVIAPPPVDSTGALIPEDEGVAKARMYNSASIVITIEQNASGTPSSTNTTINVGYIDPTGTLPSSATLSAYNSLFPTITSPTTATAADSGGVLRPTSILQKVRQQFIDPREYLNGTSAINSTTLDVGNLNTALQAIMSNPSTTAAQNLASNYNGIVYIYDNTDNTTIAPGTLNGIRLTDATTTPNFSDQDGNPIGFTVVSNNGVYIQGDYNTTNLATSGSTPVYNPASVMGDAITVLSQGWNIDQNASLIQTTYDPNNPSVPFRGAYPSSPTNAWGVNPASTGTANGLTVNAAILTGNVPTVANATTDGSGNTTYSEPVASGGVQNLVRYEEDWYYNSPHNSTATNPTGVANMSITLNGSLGQLFNSKYFTGPYVHGAQTGLGKSSSGSYNYPYIQPAQRNYLYDTNFKNHVPAGSPTTSGFSRGDFFFW